MASTTEIKAYAIRSLVGNTEWYTWDAIAKFFGDDALDAHGRHLLLDSDSIPKLISALDKLAQEGRLVTRTTSKGMTEYRYNNEAPHECNCPDCPSNL